MHFEGRWLTGRCGTERVLDLAQELNRKTKEQAEAATGKAYSAYEPWMCCPVLFDFWGVSKPESLANFSSSPKIVLEANSLIFLNKAFALSEEKPFGYLDYRESGLRVERPNAPSLSRFEKEMKQAYQLVAEAVETFQRRLGTLVWHVIPLGWTAGVN